MSKHVNIIRQILGVIVFVLAVAVLFNSINLRMGKNNIPGKTASLVLNFDSGSKRKFEGPVIDGMTVLDALGSSAKGGNFQVNYTFTKPGEVRLQSIAGRAHAIGGKAWHFYLNNKPIKVEYLDKIIIQKNDIIEARYQ